MRRGAAIGARVPSFGTRSGAVGAPRTTCGSRPRQRPPAGSPAIGSSTTATPTSARLVPASTAVDRSGRRQPSTTSSRRHASSRSGPQLRTGAHRLQRKQGGLSRRRAAAVSLFGAEPGPRRRAQCPFRSTRRRSRPRLVGPGRRLGLRATGEHGRPRLGRPQDDGPHTSMADAVLGLNGAVQLTPRLPGCTCRSTRS